MLILENFQISSTAFSKILDRKYLYQDLGIKEVIISVEKNLLILQTQCTFSVTTVQEQHYEEYKMKRNSFESY